MSRLASACAVLLLAAPLTAAAGLPPSRAAIDLAASAQVVAGCKAVPKSCAELTAVDAGYRAEFAKLLPCEADPKKCSPDLVLSVFRAAELLDLREGALPQQARATGVERPLLRLSLLLSKDATFAYAAVSTDGLIETWKKVAPYAAKDVDALCAQGPEAPACVDARKSLGDAQVAVGLAKACAEAAKPCDFDILELGAETSEASWLSYQHATSGPNIMLGTLLALIKEGQDRLALLVEADMKLKQEALTAGISELSSRVDALAGGGDASLAAAHFNALSDTYRKASLEADRLTSYGATDGAGGANFRDGVNAAATRLAQIRSRLAAASAGNVAQGLASLAGPGELPAAAAGRSALQKVSFTPGASAADPTLLDRRLIPSPPPENPSAPPILAGGSGLFQVVGNLRSKDPLKLADARRRMGLSYTVGDPSGRAALVHTQTYTDDCAVVTQQEVLLAHGLVSNADPTGTEKQLAAEAVQRGFINSGGTPTAYAADLLVDRHLLVDKRVGAPLADLDAAVRRGGMILAAVDARPLWGRTDPAALGHSILITGAEVDKKTHETVGYYINDSGLKPPGAGRFVPIETFRKAWDGLSKNYAEVR
jgi:hypothetical protein